MKTKTNSKTRRSGFTLIEIMVVVLIVGMLISMVGPRIWGALFKSQRKIVESQIMLIHQSLDMYKLENTKYPESLEQLTENDPISGQPIMEFIPPDPWQNDYLYEFDSDGSPVIISYGADGSPGGEDMDADIDSRTMRKK